MEKNGFFGTNPRFQKITGFQVQSMFHSSRNSTCHFLFASRSANTVYNNRHHKRAYIRRFLVEFATDLQSVLWLNHTHIEFIEGSIEVAQLSNFPSPVLIQCLICRTKLWEKSPKSVPEVFIWGPTEPMIFLLENHGLSWVNHGLIMGKSRVWKNQVFPLNPWFSRENHGVVTGCHG